MKKKSLKTEKQLYQSNTIFSSLHELPTIKQMVACLIDEALVRTDDNITEASRMLGISRQSLSKRINHP